MKLSVFVITWRRATLLEACVTTALADLPKDAELVVVVNGSDPDAEAILSRKNDPRFRWLVGPRELRAICRNRGFEEARGEVLLFLDDDVQVPRGYFREVMRRFEADPKLSVLGGPNRTPPDSPWREKVFGAVMTSPFAAPFVYRRYAEGGAYRAAGEHDLILCNLALRRSHVPEALRFEGGLKSNEENLFLFRCRARGLSLKASGTCFVYHRRRASLAGFLQQIFSYGFGRAQQTVRAPSSMHPAFLVPSLALVGGPLFVALNPEWLLAYGALSLFGALASRETRQLGALGTLGVWCLTPLLHVSYGVGFWAGCGEILKPRLAQVESSVVEADERPGVA